jgi:hypothetical protein
MVVHNYAVDVFMINFPVLGMPYVSCIKHVINLIELQKRYDTPLKVFWKQHQLTNNARPRFEKQLNNLNVD